MTAPTTDRQILDKTDGDRDSSRRHDSDELLSSVREPVPAAHASREIRDSGGRRFIGRRWSRRGSSSFH